MGEEEIAEAILNGMPECVLDLASQDTIDEVSRIVQNKLDYEYEIKEKRK